MYEDYFGLTQKPFSIVPDPHYFFMSAGHQEALAHLLYGIESNVGFVLLTGDVGTGKTTACRRLIELLPEDIEVAFILNPKLTVEELLATICDEFGIRYPEGNQSIKVFITRINEYLLDVHAKGRRAVLILEEAQNLKPDVLEQIRLLTNLETREHKLLQVVMIGQPELRELLLQPQLRQLSQRVTARYHLGPLSRQEIPGYVNYRLSLSGLVHDRLFPLPTLKKLARLSGGVPRLINVICERALLGAFVQGKDRVDKKTLTTAAREITGEKIRRGLSPLIYQSLPAGFLLVLLSALGIAYTLYGSWPLFKTSVRPAAQALAPKAGAPPQRKADLRRPADQSGESTKKAAYLALFRQWHLQYQKGDICEQAKLQGLRCLNGKGSLTTLRQMNKPAVLTLLDEKEIEYHATLTSLKGETATLVIGNETRTVDLKEIIRRWSGDYLLLWRVPQEYQQDLKPGSRGSMVAWLERHLTLTQGRVVSAGQEQIYDGEVLRQLQKFQLSIGLTPDGIVGPRTIMPLMAAAGNGDPVLYTAKGNP